MKISLTEKYELIVEPENVVEMLALRAWNENKGKVLLIKAYDAEQSVQPTVGIRLPFEPVQPAKPGTGDDYLSAKPHSG